MILRKPYALLIRYFKLIHVFLMFLIGYLFYLTNPLSGIFATAVRDQTSFFGRDLVSEFFPITLYISIILIIALSLTVMWLMIAKKKPYLYYLFNLVLFITLFGLLVFAERYAYEASTVIVDVIVLGTMRDFLTIATLLEIFAFVMAFIRSTGFNIKKFNFFEDLEKLDIKEEDRDEFELQLNFDLHKYMIVLRRRFRIARYVYLENKLISNAFMGLFALFIVLSLYANTILFGNFYNEGATVPSGLVTAIVNDSYATSRDYQNNTFLPDHKLVVVKTSLSSFTKNALDTATTYLFVGNKRYTPIRTYDDKIIDLGKSYNREQLDKEYQSYLLVYKVPKHLNLGNAFIAFTDYVFNNNDAILKYSKVDLNIENLDQEIITKAGTLNEEVDILDDKLNIKSITTSPTYKLEYNFCPTKTTCYPSTEVLRPKLNSYEKILVEIKATTEYNFNYLITNYALVNYQINDLTKTTRELLPISPVHAKKSGSYYYEIRKEANKLVKFSITMRNVIYEYTL